MTENIVVSNGNFEKTKERISEEGKNNFFVLADFNKTFTKAFIGGEKVSTSFSSIRDNGYLGEDYIKRSKADFETYNPIEISSEASFEEKNKALDEWWKRHFNLLVEKGISENIFDEIIDKGKVELRENVKDLLEFLHENKIPLVIVSSGLGDFIPKMLEKEGLLFDNIQIVGNMFKFDEEGNAQGFEEPLIHTINKVVPNLNLLGEDVLKRKNVLMLGDDLTDLKMMENFDYNNLVKVGFLNEKVEESLSKYKEGFDVVLTNDIDFDFVNGLVREIFN